MRRINTRHASLALLAAVAIALGMFATGVGASAQGSHKHRHTTPTPTARPTSTPTVGPKSTPTVGPKSTPKPKPTSTPTSTPTPTPTPTPTSAPNPPASSRWLPGSGPIAWQWELDHPLSVTSNTDMGIGDETYTGAAAATPTVYDIDGFDNPASTVAALHARGDHVVCYIDVGTAENWRPDYSEFPAALLGSSNGWPGENWLDTDPSGPDYSTLQSIMTARFEMCASKGFDAVEPDNMDGAENSTGFNITIAEQDQYDEWVANEVHSLGMSVAQKNYEDQSSVLEPYFDFVIEEQCFQYDDCSDLAPYSRAGKAVLEVEYQGQGSAPASFCPSANALDFDSVQFDLDLDGDVRVPCR